MLVLRKYSTEEQLADFAKNDTQASDRLCSCRICFEEVNVCKLISPCSCRGSSQYVHEQCLLEWGKRDNRIHFNSEKSKHQFICQICKNSIPIDHSCKMKCNSLKDLKSQILSQPKGIIILFSMFLASISFLIYLIIQLRRKFFTGVFEYLVIGSIALTIICILIVVGYFTNEHLIKRVDSFRVSCSGSQRSMENQERVVLERVPNEK